MFDTEADPGLTKIIGAEARAEECPEGMEERAICLSPGTEKAIYETPWIPRKFWERQEGSRSKYPSTEDDDQDVDNEEGGVRL